MTKLKSEKRNDILTAMVVKSRGAHSPHTASAHRFTAANKTTDASLAPS